MNGRILLYLCWPLLSMESVCMTDEPPVAQLRAGIIGLDTSHVPAFTRLFNEATADSELAAIKVVAGYPGGTDIPASRDRVSRFTEQLRGMGVEIVATIPALLARVDVVLLESVDGRIHLAEAIPVIKAGKPLFIDKPVAGSLADAIVIYELARRYKVPCFSSSSYWFSPSLQKLRADPEVGHFVGAATWGPCRYQGGIPDMFYYGVHAIEALFALMGPGCETVTRVNTPKMDLVTGVWEGGRIGTYHGIRTNKTTFGAVAFGGHEIVQAERESGSGYEELCREIVRFFKTGKAPVTPEETLERFAFMEAADESKRRDGAAVSLREVLARARDQAAAKLRQE